jgi:hypothetical protein
VEDLKRAPFFDERTATFLRRLLATYGQQPGPISGTETELSAEKNGLRELDGCLQGNLVSYLLSCKEYVAVPDGAFFLLDAMRVDMLKQAQEIMDMTVREGIELTVEELYSALEESKTLSTDWLVSFFGKVTEGRHAREQEKLSRRFTGLNLDAMRDFK